jgi:hypothetical protein
MGLRLNEVMRTQEMKKQRKAEKQIGNKPPACRTRSIFRQTSGELWLLFFSRTCVSRSRYSKAYVVSFLSLLTSFP